MKYVLDIDVNDAKAKALLQYISTLDFVTVVEDEDSKQTTNEYVGYSYAESKSLTKQDVIERSLVAKEQYLKGECTTHEDLLKESENW